MLALAAALVPVVVLQQGADPLAGAPVAAEGVDTGGGGSPAGSAAPVLPVIRHVGTATATSRSDDATVAAVLADLNAYWSATLPADFGKPFVPLEGGSVSIDSTAATGSSWCIGTPSDIAGNAYYCPAGDGIVYDSAGLIPVLIGSYGAAGLTAALAHEFGHAIQAQIGPTAQERAAHPDLYPGILIEAQGDCYAGAFLNWTVAGHSTRVRIPASSMVRAAAPQLDFRDPVTLAVGDPTSHGTGLDRLNAVLLGYSSGAKACSTLTRAAMTPALARPGASFGAPSTTARFAELSGALAAGRASVLGFAGSLPNNPSTVAAGSPLPADLAAAGPYGQFAQAATVALAVGRAVTGNDVGATCFTGAWTASVFGTAPPGALGSWPGDADEAVDLLRARPTATFEELAGFADGFRSGFQACRKG